MPETDELLKRLSERSEWYRRVCKNLVNPMDVADELDSAIDLIRALRGRTLADASKGTSFLFAGLLQRLPPEGQLWGMHDRLHWLQLAVGIFEVVYNRPPGDERAINVEFFESHPALPFPAARAANEEKL